MDEILARLDEADVPAGRIYSVADIVDDPHYAARQMILRTELPGDVTVKMPGITPKLSDTPGAVKWSGPTLGQHTDEVLTGLGLQAGDIAELRRSGAVQ
jgi:crotonobetainyl-CoA:carnitine CoA-transferase CaiB-like acyl-CoA transferase